MLRKGGTERPKRDATILAFVVKHSDLFDGGDLTTLICGITTAADFKFRSGSSLPTRKRFSKVFILTSKRITLKIFEALSILRCDPVVMHRHLAVDYVTIDGHSVEILDVVQASQQIVDLVLLLQRDVEVAQIFVTHCCDAVSSRMHVRQGISIQIELLQLFECRHVLR